MAFVVAVVLAFGGPAACCAGGGVHGDKQWRFDQG